MTAMMTPDQPSPPLLRVSHLALTRGGRTLFDNVGFNLSHGEMVLVRGPNGAGKSSLLLTIAGILRADSGEIWWNPQKLTALHFLGLAPGIKPWLTLGENLSFWRSLYGATGREPAAALEAVGLGGLDDIEAGHLSTGQTQRLGLARLLVSERQIWLLDEPTSSLDTEGEKLVSALILQHLVAGGAALVATHHDIPVGGMSMPSIWRTITLGDRP